MRRARRWVEENWAELKAMWDESRGDRMNDEVTRVTKARPMGGLVLHVRFAGDRMDRSST